MRRKEKEITDINEMEKVILKADVCRVAFADNGSPYIVTMNFGYSGGEPRKLYFHCAREGKKIDMIKINNYVCFEMDTDHELYTGMKACDFGMKYRSVLGWGRISIVTGEKEKAEGLNRIMMHYTGRENFMYEVEILERMMILSLEISEITGKSSY